MKKRERRKKRNVSTHHIIPVSRGGNGDEWNKARLKKWEHALYHALFNNKTPDEIVEYLVETFWNGQWEWVDKARRGVRDDQIPADGACLVHGLGLDSP